MFEGWTGSNGTTPQKTVTITQCSLYLIALLKEMEELLEYIVS
ncbi:MAG: hypothetical protein K5923_07165 [Clostridia bacterium]|nr:hypothetical protein [Clostridia bacterium]